MLRAACGDARSLLCPTLIRLDIHEFQPCTIHTRLSDRRKAGEDLGESIHQQASDAVKTCAVTDAVETACVIQLSGDGGDVPGGADTADGISVGDVEDSRRGLDRATPPQPPAQECGASRDRLSPADDRPSDDQASRSLSDARSQRETCMAALVGTSVVHCFSSVATRHDNRFRGRLSSREPGPLCRWSQWSGRTTDVPTIRSEVTISDDPVSI